ncbi:hypothetical protein ACKKBG_A24730 [Auxenochlorella protothecoides x Auxenochlorella symbiontica]
MADQEGGGTAKSGWSLGGLLNYATQTVNSVMGYDELSVVDPNSQSAGSGKDVHATTKLEEDRKQAFKSYKDYLGKDITSLVILPVWIMQPFTMLQNMAEIMEYTEALDKAAVTEDPYERLAWVVGYTMGPFGAIERPWKPFNPILGETFEYHKPSTGIKYLVEQVSHHPPIGAGHAESPLWTYDLVSAPKTKFLGNSVEVYPIGRTRIRLKTTDEVFSLVPPTSKANNVILGSTWVDTYGDYKLLNVTTGARAHMVYKECGWFGSGRYEIDGYIYREDGTKAYILEGKWNEYLDAARCDEAGEMLPDAEILHLWKCKDKPENDPYAFTHFAHELNSANGLSPLPSDSRRRPDRALLEAGQSSEAAVAKYNLEEMQRKERREREERGEVWAPRWFRPLGPDAEVLQDEYDNEQCAQYEFTGDLAALEGPRTPEEVPEDSVCGKGFVPWTYPEIHDNLGKEAERQ